MRKLRRTATLLLAILVLATGCGPKQPTPTATIPPSSTPRPTATSAPMATPTPVTYMFRNGPEHLGVYATQPGAAEWMLETGAMLDTSPTVADGRVYFGGYDNIFRAVDVRTGEEIWTFPTRVPVVSSPAIADGLVYFGTLGNTFYALAADTGEKLWMFEVGGPIVSSPAVGHGMVYFCAFDETFYALDARTGEQKWTFDIGAQAQSSPALFGDSVYVGGGEGNVYALDATTGAVQWTFATAQPVIAAPSIVRGVAYAAGMDGTLYALDLQAGELQWSVETQIPIVTSPAVTGGMLYFATAEGTLRALDLATQAGKWQFKTGDVIISSPAVADGVVYIGSLDGRLYAVDAASGQEKWRFQTEGQVWSSPAVAGDYVYFGSYDGRMYAVNRQQPQIALAPTATPPPLQPTPTMLPPLTAKPAVGAEGLPWWNDRIFYEVFVRSFYDGNGDGIGDLKGLISKLDYLNDGDPTTTTDLGVTGIWLMPVTESPSYHGYDVVDYKKIEQDYGTNEDFKTLLAEAHKRGMAVIVDLVMNHTSDEHPWFVDAKTPGSEHENWYIWTTERPNYEGMWGQQVWYPLGLRYYFALFWEKMPDLNFRNGAVTDAMFDIIKFWLGDMAVDGFRLDAVRHLIEDGAVQANTPETHAWLQNFHRYVHTLNPQALTVGEVWDTTEEVVKYIGNEVDMAFEFDVAAATLESIWRHDSTAVTGAWQNALDSYSLGQYATFLTNHDQNRTMNQVLNNVDGAKQAAVLLMTSLGVPFVYYGEEIGMRGTKPDERIRTPMQWDASATAGFTTGTPWEALSSGVETFNVAVEDADPDSLLNLYRTLIRLRQEHPSLRAGEMSLVSSDNRKVYAYLRHSEKETTLVVVSLADEPVSDYTLSLEKGPLAGTPDVQVLLGQGNVAAPTVNAAGGFDDYTPLPTLAPRENLVLLLE